MSDHSFFEQKMSGLENRLFFANFFSFALFERVIALFKRVAQRAIALSLFC